MSSRMYQTIVRNTSGVEMHFSFLGANGATLASGADYAVNGDLWTMHAKNKLKVEAIDYALTNGLLEVLKSPEHVIQDTSNGIVRRVKVTGGTLGVLDPDYGSYSGSAASPSN